MIPVRLRVVALPSGSRPTRNERFSVQVASFTSEYRAAVLRDILDQGWRGTHVEPAEAGGQTLYQVRVGTYSSRREARRQAFRLGAVGYPVIVIEE